ncbi:hypothetical protein BG003_005624 [Podila horticola]|nr:hypothetical protein BG003_005624 [Podila horticola]
MSSGDMSTAEDRSNRAGLPRMIMWQIKHLKQLRDLRLCLEDYTWRDSAFREDENNEIASWEAVIESYGTKNVGDALHAFEDLEDLETLELRNMKDYVDPARLKSSRQHWKKLRHWPRLHKLELIHVWNGDNTLLVQLAKIVREHCHSRT